ncbi:MAG: hypothetical protein GY851_03890 [bacterium]|nr:hypothetical protein [bacterium]
MKTEATRHSAASRPALSGLLAAALLVCVAATGCQHAGPDASSIPLPAAGSLDGAIICVDPGHGGPWPGAVAPNNSLRESDVNLRVGQHLKRILERAGAQVVMTRIADVALDETSLGRDLAARAAVAGQAGAHVFVSIHHNADIRPRSGKNDLEVYYRLSDDAASLDLAQCLTGALGQWLRAEAQGKRLLPGNYRVLRESSVPAVLLESSYMTHRRYARYLATDAAAEAEARAIARGLETYFALDPPVVASAEAHTRGAVTSIEVLLSRGTPIDPKSVQAYDGEAPLDGECAPTDTGFLWVFREPLSNDAHDIVVRGRNHLGASFRHAAHVDVARPAHSVSVVQRPSPLDDKAAAEVLLEGRVRDGGGMPVADGTAVSLEPLGSSVTTKSGAARFYIPADELPERVTMVAGPARATHTICRGASDVRTLRVVDQATGDPVPGVLALSRGECAGVATEDGWIAVHGPEYTVTLVRGGYETVEATASTARSTVALRRLHASALAGHTVAVDAAYGGRLPGPTGPSGIRACDVNRDIADRLGCLLRKAGASVVFTRNGDRESSDLERVRLATAVNAEVLVSISVGLTTRASRVLDDTGHSGGVRSSFVGHYPGSTKGTRLATMIADALGDVSAVPCVAYLVQQTACPAVLVQPGALESYADEERFAQAAERERIADAVFQGLVTLFGE